MLTGRSWNLKYAFLDEETPITPAAVTVRVYPEGSDTAVFTGPAALVSGSWVVTVPAQVQGVYRVVWDGSPTAVDTAYVEVVGGLLFTVPEARDSDSELTDASDYPAAEIAHYREVIAAEFETITGRSFTPRTARVSFETDGSDAVWLGKFDCVSLEALEGLPDGSVVSDFTVDANGVLSGLSGLSEGLPLVAVVDYGFRMVPLDVKRAALLRLRYLLAAESSGVPDRATSYVAAEGGTFTLATAGRAGYETGIPEVDKTLTDYSRKILHDVMAAG